MCKKTTMCSKCAARPEPNYFISPISLRLKKEPVKSTFFLNDFFSDLTLGIVIGNDISLPRLKITKNLINKYQKRAGIYLLNEDARALPQNFFLNAFEATVDEHIYSYRRSTEKTTGDEACPLPIDKVLVDVECSHDGSLKHMLKYFAPKNQKKKKKSRQEPLFTISNREKKRRAKQARSAQSSLKSNRLTPRNRLESAGLPRTCHGLFATVFDMHSSAGNPDTRRANSQIGRRSGLLDMLHVGQAKRASRPEGHFPNQPKFGLEISTGAGPGTGQPGPGEPARVLRPVRLGCEALQAHSTRARVGECDVHRQIAESGPISDN